jgi:amino acid adenylation domain-containing protein/thioester reductase-like protein
MSDYGLIKASPYTRFFWTEYQLNSRRNDYNIVFDQRISGNLDIKKLSESLEMVVIYLPLFDSHLISINDILYWEKNLATSKLEFFENTNDEKEFAEKSFNLKTGPLYRFGIFKISENKYNFIIVLHHAIIDSSSFDKFLYLISIFYSSKEDVSIFSSKISEFNNSLIDQLKLINESDANNFWREKLINAENKNNIPYIKSDNIGVGEYYFSINKDDLNLSVIEKLESTLFLFLSSIFGFMMSRYCRSDNVILAHLLNFEKAETLLLGGGTNIFLLPINIKENLTFSMLLGENDFSIKNGILEKTINHDYFPTNKILSSSNISELNIFFTERNLKNKKLSFEGCCLDINKRYNIDILGSELMVEYEDDCHFLNFNFKYKKSLFDKDYIKQISDEFCHLLQFLGDAKNSDKKLSEICLLTENEYKKVVYDWNDTVKKYPKEKTIHALFEQQVARTPDNTALVCEDLSISYQELNDRANRISHHIINKYNIGSDELIALFLDKNEYAVIAILAVLKTGGAYVPIDPGCPNERIQYILDDTKATIILVNRQNKTRLESIIRGECFLSAEKCKYIPRIITLDIEEFEKELLVEKTTDPVTNGTSNNLAYVIYTSGSTGKPKGVMIEHKGVVNLVLSQGRSFGLANSKNKHCLWYSSYVFDAHVSEIYTGLLYGHIVYIINDEIKKSISLLNEYIKLHGINIATIPPILLDSKEILKLETLVIAGDKAAQEVFCRYSDNNIKIINAYGPTEVTVCSSLNHYCDNGVTNIGSPIPNTTAYVLSSDLQPLPLGVVGELYIGGVGLARGYLNNLELTVERFIPNPFQTKKEKKIAQNDRLYKTGDLVRLLPDGNLEYVGRNDFQVKIRGFRVELGEVENVLSSYIGVKQCVAIVKESTTSGKHKYLVGYYMADKPLEAESIISYLKGKLPEYMVPASLIYLEKLPVNIAGKIDRGSLPEVNFSSNSSYLPARNKIERQLCKIWEEVLELPQGSIGIKDDFFGLGGDSIISIQLVSRVRQNLGLKISTKNIFDCKNIVCLYENVLRNDLNFSDDIKIEKNILESELEFLSIQQWFFYQNFEKTKFWKESFIVRTPLLDVEQLKQSIAKAIDQHDVFKLRYGKEQGKHTQYYMTDQKKLELKTLDISKLKSKENGKYFSLELKGVLKTWENELNLELGITHIIGYLHGYEDKSARIYFLLHYLIADTVSAHILIEDIYEFYKNSSLILESKGMSYRKCLELVNNYNGNRNGNEQKFFEEKLLNYNLKIVQFPIVSETTQVNFYLTKELTSQLRDKSNSIYNTETVDILLTALGYALYSLTKDQVNYIHLEESVREKLDGDIDLSRTIGRFTNIYPIRLEIVDDLRQSLINIKEYLRYTRNGHVGCKTLAEDIDFSKIYFHYLGEFEDYITGDWYIERKDINKEVAPVNVFCTITDNALRVSIKANLPKYETDEISKIFKNKLTEIINFTTNGRKYLTLSDIDYIISWEYLNKLQEIKEIEGIYLANSLQQGFIYHYLKQGEIDNAYRVQLTWEYNAYLNIHLLEESWRLAQKKYSSLRLRFAWDEELVQVIDQKGNLDWKFLDLSLQSMSNQKIRLEQLQKNVNQELYSLESGSLFRIYMVKQKEDLYTCIFSNHHAILDGWSYPILLDYVHEVYLNLLVKKESDFSVDYIYSKVQSYIQNGNKDTREYWDQYMSQVKEKDDLTVLMDKIQKTDLSGYRHVKDPKSQEFIVEDKIYYELKHLTRTEGITLNAVLQYVWHKVLSIYCNTNQTIVGTTVAGRALPIDGLESSVGLYINTLPLVVNHDPSKTIISEIKSIQDHINEINLKSDVSLVELQGGRERLFSSLFVYENYPTRARLFLHENYQTPADKWQHKLRVEFKSSIGNIDYPLTVMTSEGNNCLVFKLMYAGELFTDSIIKRLLLTTKTILDQINQNNVRTINAKLEYLTTEQYAEIFKWSNTGNYEESKTIQALFEEQVARTPDNLALMCEDLRLSYQELNTRANQLAFYVNSIYDVTPDTLIAICLERNEHVLIGMLAILKAGGAYVPIDLTYPEERIRYILEDANAKIILANKVNEEKLRGVIKNNDVIKKIELIFIDSLEAKNELLLQPKRNPITNVSISSLAYVMYTSGTTGKPKGVMIEHKGVVSLVKGIGCLDINFNDSFIQLADMIFDAATFEIFASILNGAKLLMPRNVGELLFNVEKLSKVLIKNKVSILWLTKSLFDQLFLSDPNIFGGIRYLFVGGEALNEKLIRRLIRLDNSPENVINGYGPTENTTFSCTFNVKDRNLNKTGPIPIGKPLINRMAYILSDSLIPLPIGAIGELYLGGAGLARGYLNNPSLTAEKFIDNPFQTDNERHLNQNTKLYKTGDLARWLPDGNIEYVGRNDLQVKIRGYRIELREIENTILSYPGVTQCTVIVKKYTIGVDFDNKYLVGYYIADEPLDDTLLMCYLRKKLPAYMFPKNLVYLKCFPLTINGKLNFNLLPDVTLGVSSDYVEPGNELEREICKIWAEVLGKPLGNIGIRDDFFYLGGNSILSISLTNKLNKFLRKNKKILVDLSLASFLRNRTVEKIVGLLDVNVSLLIKQKANLFKSDIILKSDIKVVPVIQKRIQRKNSIFLTGSSGLLGSHLLSNLLTMSDYKVYCLIRGGNDQEAFEKLSKSFKKYNLNCGSLVNDRLEIIVGDFSHDKFSMKENDYCNLTKEIDSVIHNGALVNHVYPYELLRDSNVKSIENILRFSLTGKQKKINYVSTLSVIDFISNYQDLSKNFLKLKISEINLDHGYVSTKLASEILLRKAHARGFNVKIFRPGLMFNMREDIYDFKDDNHFYSFISSLIQFQKYPNLNINFDISSVEFVSNVMARIIFDESIEDNVFNFSNPTKISLKKLMNYLKLKGFKLEPISLEDWRNLMKKIDENNNLFKFSSLYASKFEYEKKEISSSIINGSVCKYLGKIEKIYLPVLVEEIVEGVARKLLMKGSHL